MTGFSRVAELKASLPRDFLIYGENGMGACSGSVDFLALIALKILNGAPTLFQATTTRTTGFGATASAKNQSEPTLRWLCHN